VQVPRPLRRRLLVLAAHPDDETLGAGGILASCAADGRVAVLILTDGVPVDPTHFAVSGRWSPDAYRQLRRHESLRALSALGLDARFVFFGCIPDQQLAWHLKAGWNVLLSVVRQFRPQVLLAPAFEGGHPDHDAANFLASRLQTSEGPDVWEYPLYTVRDGQPCHLRFRDLDSTVLNCELDAELQTRKTAALSCYASQAATLAGLGSVASETIRPLPAHAYHQPALPEPAVYERWGWPITAAAVARQFEAALGSRWCGSHPRHPGRHLSAPCACSPPVTPWSP